MSIYKSADDGDDALPVGVKVSERASVSVACLHTTSYLVVGQVACWRGHTLIQGERGDCADALSGVIVIYTRT